MPTSLVALQIFLVLLPGFACAYIVQLLVSRRPFSDLERVIEALLYSSAIYVLYVLFNHGQLPFHLAQDKGGSGQTILWDSSRLFVLAGSALLVAFFVAAYYRYDGNKMFRLFDSENPWVCKWLGWLQLTERTAEDSLWNVILESVYTDDQRVEVELSDGRRVRGTIGYYSDVHEDFSLYVSEPRWVSPEGVEKGSTFEGVLLTNSCEIRSISLFRSSSGPGVPKAPRKRGKPVIKRGL